MKVVYMSPYELTPYTQNAKVHTPDQIRQIANSIQRFGFQQPIVVDREHVVIIGHGRLAAAKELNLDDVPVVFADQLSEEDVKALRLADNKLNESPWDFSLLEQELAELDIAGIDMTQFGFDEDEDFTDAQRQIEEDSIPETPSEPVSKRGDIWKLGEHRLMCGDSTNRDDVSDLMGG